MVQGINTLYRIYLLTKILWFALFGLLAIAMFLVSQSFNYVNYI